MLEAPSVVVLLATYNGLPYLPAQVESILGQTDVTVRIVASDDGSSDGTTEWLAALTAREPRVTLLPAMRSGGAAANFYRLIDDATIAPDELIAFADQDDIWLPEKLAMQIRLMNDHNADVVSGSVLAFHEDGREHLVKKNYPQRRFDWLTESPGPGCSFLMTPRFVELARRALTKVPEARTAEFHDSLLYVIGRAKGWNWHIGGTPLIRYRQHDTNVLGANQGARSAATRLSMMRSRWHRGQAIIHAQVGREVADASAGADLDRVLSLLRSRRLRDRWRLARLAPQLRRRPRDRVVICAMIALGLW